MERNQRWRWRLDKWPVLTLRVWTRFCTNPSSSRWAALCSLIWKLAWRKHLCVTSVVKRSNTWGTSRGTCRHFTRCMSCRASTATSTSLAQTSCVLTWGMFMASGRSWFVAAASSISQGKSILRNITVKQDMMKTEVHNLLKKVHNILKGRGVFKIYIYVLLGHATWWILMMEGSLAYKCLLL